MMQVQSEPASQICKIGLFVFSRIIRYVIMQRIEN